MDLDKPAEQSTRPELPEGSCHFYIERKKRYCRFKPAKSSSYCAEHVTTFETNIDRKRMVCPYDAKHTCYVDKLTHHMNRCPSRPKEMPAYYSKGVNSGDNAGEEVPSPKIKEELKSLRKRQLTQTESHGGFFESEVPEAECLSPTTTTHTTSTSPVLDEIHATVLTVSAEELQTIIDKVNKLYKEYIEEIPVEILSHSCLREELENTSYGTAALRHRRQMASLIGHMEKLQLLRNGLCYVEMGAGKGQLSHWLHSAIEKKDNTSFVLIDRSHVRNKMDNLHKEEEIMHRYRMDIEHLKLGCIPTIESEERPVVTYGKHLCGPATDLALRCATETLSQSKTVNSNDTERGDEPQRKRHKSDKRCLSGCVIALCCHHRCTWPAYVGKKFIQNCGLTARDFQLLSSMSSWATCTWKGWSHTKKTEGDQMKTGSDAISAKEKGSDVTGLTGEADEKHNKCGSLVKTRNNEVVSSTHNITNNGDKSETKQVTGKDLSEIEKCKDRDDLTEVTQNSDSDVDDHEDSGKDAVNNSIKSQLSEKEREVIGRKCKCLIDYGRVKYLEDHGLTSCLKVYIEDFYTPENVVLLAKLE